MALERGHIKLPQAKKIRFRGTKILELHHVEVQPTK
jgi:hypothetical protein